MICPQLPPFVRDFFLSFYTHRLVGISSFGLFIHQHPNSTTYVYPDTMYNLNNSQSAFIREIGAHVILPRPLCSMQNRHE